MDVVLNSGHIKLYGIHTADTWEISSFGASRPNWHQAFLTRFLPVLGFLGGEKADSAAKPFPRVAHTQEEEETGTL